MPTNGSAATPLLNSTLAGGIAAKANALLSNPIVDLAAGALAGGAIAAGVTYAATRRKTTKRKATKRTTKRTTKRKPKFGTPGFRKLYGAKSKRNAARNKRGGAVKSRYKGKRVLLTKKGQPYVLMANGKARFVKR